MKIKFLKTQTQETDKDKIVKLTLGGSLNGVVYNLQVSGDAEEINNLKQELKLGNYGTMVDLDVYNNQTTVNEYNKEDK